MDTRNVLADHAITSSLQDMIMEDDDLEPALPTFKVTVYDTVKSVLDHSKDKQPDWCDKSTVIWRYKVF